MKAIEETEKKTEGPVEDQNIDKIRDILFGVQVREFEGNFSKLEEKFANEVENLRNETRSKLDKLEEFINREFNSVTDKVVEEQRLRSEAIKNLTDQVENTANELDEKIQKVNEQTANNESEIRKQILDQSKLLSDSIENKQKELKSDLERESSELRDDKADRVALADLFTEMAMRLAGNFKLPESDDHEMNDHEPPQ